MNSYYNRIYDFVPFTKARSGQVDDEWNAIVVAFDLLPSDSSSMTRGTTTYATETGAGNAYVVAMPNTRTANLDGDHVAFQATHPNTSVITINVDTIGDIVAVRADGNAFESGDIITGLIYHFRYDLANSRFQMLGPSTSYLTNASASASASAASASASAASASNALTSEGIASEWAINPVNDDVTGSGGQFSSLHWASGSQAWAVNPEDVLVPVSFGGDGTTEFSAFHWAQKALAGAADTTQVTGTGVDLPSAPGTSNANLPWRNVNGIDWATVGFNADVDFTINNLAHGGNVILSGESTAGALRSLIIADPDADVSLYYDGTVRISTANDGAVITGTVLDLNNSAAATAAFMRARNSEGGIAIRADGGAGHIFQTDSAGALQDTWIEMDANAGVGLYYDNTRRLRTVIDGAVITGGLLDLDNSASAVTARLGLRNSDGGAALHATGGAVTLYQTTSAGVTQDVWLSALPNAAVSLYFNGTARLITTNFGGDSIGSEFNVDNSANLGPAKIGVRNSEGGVELRADSGDVTLYQTDNTGSVQDIWIFGAANGAVSLYYNGSAKLSTTNTGVDISGGLTVDGGDFLLKDANPEMTFQPLADTEFAQIRFIDTAGTLDGRILFNYTTGDIVFSNNGTVTALTIDASQDAVFAGDITLSAGRILVTDPGTAGDPVIELGTTGSGIYFDAGNNLAISHAATKIVGFSDVGLELVNGNFVLGTSGKGIDFSATSDASGMLSELLDDYEEGTWTPTLSFAGGSGTILYGNQLGRYTKIGNVVNFWMDLTTTSLASRTGALAVQGLPYTSSGAMFGSATVGFGAGLAIGAGDFVSTLVFTGATQAVIYVWDSTTGSTPMQSTEWTDDGRIIFGGSYFV